MAKCYKTGQYLLVVLVLALIAEEVVPTVAVAAVGAGPTVVAVGVGLAAEEAEEAGEDIK